MVWFILADQNAMLRPDSGENNLSNKLRLQRKSTSPLYMKI